MTFTLYPLQALISVYPYTNFGSDPTNSVLVVIQNTSNWPIHNLLQIESLTAKFVTAAYQK